jgi:hypothetical protein
MCPTDNPALRIRVSEPGRGDGLLRAIKIRSTPSFEWEVKTEVPCRKILRHVKRSRGKVLTSSSIPPTCPRCLCWYDYQRALVDESGVIPSRNHHHHGSPCSNITRGMNNRPVGGRSSETQSHPILMKESINQTNRVSVVWILTCPAHRAVRTP